MISKYTKFDLHISFHILSIVYILKCLYLVIRSELYTTLNAGYRVWSKSPCALDDYSIEFRCPETFWSPCISFGFCNVLSLSVTISVVTADRVFDSYEGNIAVVLPNFINGLHFNMYSSVGTFSFWGGRWLYTLFVDTELFHLSVPCCSLFNFRLELAYNCGSFRRCSYI